MTLCRFEHWESQVRSSHWLILTLDPEDNNHALLVKHIWWVAKAGGKSTNIGRNGPAAEWRLSLVPLARHLQLAPDDKY